MAVCEDSRPCAREHVLTGLTYDDAGRGVADDFSFTGTLAFDLIRFWGLLPTGSLNAPNIFWETLNGGGTGIPTRSVASGSVVAQRTHAAARSGTGAGYDNSAGHRPGWNRAHPSLSH